MHLQCGHILRVSAVCERWLRWLRELRGLHEMHCEQSWTAIAASPTHLLISYESFLRILTEKEKRQQNSSSCYFLQSTTVQIWY